MCGLTNLRGVGDGCAVAGSCIGGFLRGLINLRGFVRDMTKLKGVGDGRAVVGSSTVYRCSSPLTPPPHPRLAGPGSTTWTRCCSWLENLMGVDGGGELHGVTRCHAPSPRNRPVLDVFLGPDANPPLRAAGRSRRC